MSWNLAKMVTVPGRALCCLSLRATGFLFSFLFLSFLKGKNLSSLALFRAVSILSEEGKWPLTVSWGQCDVDERHVMSEALPLP